MTAIAKVKDYYYGTGKRKSSVAKVFIKPGKGEFLINNKSIEEFFGGYKSAKIKVTQAFEIVGMQGQFDVKVTVRGGGTTAQSEATRHGLALALIDYDVQTTKDVPAEVTVSQEGEEGEGSSAPKTFKQKLRYAGYVTTDARKKERKKPGLTGARGRPQFTKR